MKKALILLVTTLPTIIGCATQQGRSLQVDTHHVYEDVLEMCSAYYLLMEQVAKSTKGKEARQMERFAIGSRAQAASLITATQRHTHTSDAVIQRNIGNSYVKMLRDFKRGKNLANTLNPVCVPAVSNPGEAWDVVEGMAKMNRK